METKKKEVESEKPAEVAAPKPKVVDPLLNDDSDDEEAEVCPVCHFIFETLPAFLIMSEVPLQ